jgi:Fe-coproporphyrin III synthase
MSPHHGSELSTVLEGEESVIATMPVLVLNVHSRCNCRCVMCDIWKRDQSTEITAASLEKHRESLRRLKVEWVVLTGGEPLMHSDLRALCMFFRDLNIRLTLLTTGLLLVRRAADVAALFDDVIVSLDGPPAIHDAIRRVRGCFNRIGEGVAAVRCLRPHIRITARTTVQKANHLHLRETVRSARSLGLNGISFLAADVTSDAFNRPLIWPGSRQSEVTLSVAEVDDLEKELEALVEEFSSESDVRYVAESPAKLRRIVHHFRVQGGLCRPQSPVCNAPWVSAVIEVDGSVRPCFFHNAVGNVQDDTLEDIINGSRARQFRSQLNVAANPTCQRCVCSLYRPQSSSA